MKALLLTAVALVSAHGAEPRMAWADAHTNLLGGPSPDGKLLSFVDSRTGDLAVRDMESGGVRRLTRQTPRGEFAYFSAISPDSKRIAYAWFNDARFYDLRVLEIDKPEPRILFRNEEAGFVQPCAWSPDGKSILTLFFRKDNISQIALVSAADGKVKTLKSLNWAYPKKMDFSPDGKWIVYDNFARGGANQRDIFLLSADGERESELIEHAANDLFPLWTADGKWIYFGSDRGGTMDAWRVAVADGQAGEPELVHRDMGRYLPMGITRAGLLYYGVNAGATDVFLAPLDTQAMGVPRRASVRFPGRNFAPAFSADGKLLAFLSRRGTENYGQASRAITIRRLDSDDEREVAPKLAHIESIAFSPDSKTLLAAGSDAKGRGGLFLVDAETGEHRTLLTAPDAPFRGYPAAWLDAGHVVYARGEELLRISLAKRDTQVIAKAPVAITRVAAAGGKIAYAAGSVFVRSGETIQRQAFPSDVRSLGVGFVATSDAIHIDRKKLAMPGEFSGDAALAPDGKTVAFTAGRERQEVWVLAHETAR